VKPSHGRRTWVKLWVNDWLEGTTRYQMSDAQRAFWIDLLAMAGRSRFGGIVCSGKDGEQWIGYPLSKFQGLLTEAIDVEATFELFQRTEKITMQVAGQGARKLYTLFILNWEHYQSEYERKKSEKKRRTETIPPDIPKMSAGMSHPMSLKSTSTEVEEEGKGDGDGWGKQSAPKIGAPLAQARQQPSLLAFSGVHLSVSLQQDHTLGEAFPWVDRPREYAKANSWLEANPNRRPRKLKPFLHNWFSKIAAPTGEKGGMTRAEQRTLNNLKAAGFVQ